MKTNCEVLITLINNIFAVLVLNLLYLWWWYWQCYGATLILNSSRRLNFIISKSTVRAFKWHKNYLFKEWNSCKQQPCCPLLKKWIRHQFSSIPPPLPPTNPQCDLCARQCWGKDGWVHVCACVCVCGGDIPIFGLRWLNTVLQAVSSNSRDSACFKLDKQTWWRKKQWYTENDFSKSHLYNFVIFGRILTFIVF